MKDILLYWQKYEKISHVLIHFLIGLWRVDYSIVAAISIEGSDAMNKRFELIDWVTRLGGCVLAYFVKPYI